MSVCLRRRNICVNWCRNKQFWQINLNALPVFLASQRQPKDNKNLEYLNYFVSFKMLNDTKLSLNSFWKIISSVKKQLGVSIHFSKFWLIMFCVTDGGLTWCRLAYWEERSRVGHQVPVTSNAVEVFNQVPRPNPGHDSMCLESLHSLNPKPSQSTVRTREKIGLGKVNFDFENDTQ